MYVCSEAGKAQAHLGGVDVLRGVRCNDGYIAVAVWLGLAGLSHACASVCAVARARIVGSHRTSIDCPPTTPCGTAIVTASIAG